MQNGVTRQTSPIRRARHQSNFAPAANAASYMDLLKFEQRMIQNVQSLDAQRRKYSCVLGRFRCLSTLANSPSARVCTRPVADNRLLCLPSFSQAKYCEYMACLVVRETDDTAVVPRPPLHRLDTPPRLWHGLGPLLRDRNLC